MKKFRLQFGSYSGNIQKIVEAQSEEEAIDKAVKALYNLRINKCDLMWIKQM